MNTAVNILHYQNERNKYEQKAVQSTFCTKTKISLILSTLKQQET